MTQAVAAPYTIAANLRWFAAWILAVALASAVYGYVAGRLGIGPEFIPLWLGYLGYAVFAFWGGRRFLQKRGGQWTLRDRVSLTAGYALVDGIISTLATVLTFYFTSLLPTWLQDSFWPIVIQGAATRFAMELAIGFTVLGLVMLVTADASAAKVGRSQ